MEPDVPYVAENWTGGNTVTTESSGGGFGWIGDIAKYGLKSAIDKEFNIPFRTDSSGQYGIDPYGRLYLRGTPTGGISTPIDASNMMPWLIGGGVVLAVVLAVVLLKD